MAKKDKKITKEKIENFLELYPIIANMYLKNLEENLPKWDKKTLHTELSVINKFYTWVNNKQKE